MAGKTKYYNRKPAFKKAVTKIVKKQLDKAIEDKYVDYAIEAQFSSVGATWIEYVVTAIGQGTTTLTRIGRKIRVKSLEITGVLTGGAAESAADDAYNAFRIVCLQTGGYIDAPLDDSNADIDTAIRTNSTGQGQIQKVLLDKYIALNTNGAEKGGGDGYAAQAKVFKWKHYFKGGLPIVWSTDTTSFPNRSLIVAMVSNSTAVVNPGFIAGRISICFEDA